MLRGAIYKKRKKIKNDEYSDLPSPSLEAKTIHLAPKKKAQHPLYELRKMPIRQCILKYAKEEEGERLTGAKEEESEIRGEDVYGYCEYGIPDPISRCHVKSKTPVLGSGERDVLTNGNYGFFSSILEAYNNHWSLRTCVEDWWYTIIRRIAIAIDGNSKSVKVREFFVSHEEGKIVLTVNIDPDIYGVDYSWFLDQMTSQISKNIKVPNYVDLLKADFSTSTKTHAIVSEITVMASVQEFFEYATYGCGIPSLKMEGEEEDWKRMKTKFLQLKKLLEPIHEAIGLKKKWWDGVEEICEHLINTFNGKPDVKWWSNVITFKEGWGGMGESGMGEPDSWDGWFISQLLGLQWVNKLEKLNHNGVITVPMTITGMGPPEESAFAAGITGFEMFKEKDSSWPSVKAVHGWTLMLEPHSAFRADLNKWESQLTKGA